MTLGSGAGSTKELATWGDVMFWKRRWNDPTMIQNSGAAVKWLQEYVAHRWRWVTPERPGETVKPWLHSHATVQHCTGQIAGENGFFLHSWVLRRAVFTASCQPKQFVWQALGQCSAVGPHRGQWEVFLDHLTHSLYLFVFTFLFICPSEPPFLSGSAAGYLKQGPAAGWAGRCGRVCI